MQILYWTQYLKWRSQISLMMMNVTFYVCRLSLSYTVSCCYVYDIQQCEDTLLMYYLPSSYATICFGSLHQMDGNVQMVLNISWWYRHWSVVLYRNIHLTTWTEDTVQLSNVLIGILVFLLQSLSMAVQNEPGCLLCKYLSKWQTIIFESMF